MKGHGAASVDRETNKVFECPLASAIVVTGPLLPVKMPLPASLRLAKKATVPSLLMELPPKLVNGPLLSAILMKL
jgi:hypothetical protein